MFKPTHRRATLQECEDFKLKNLDWDFNNERLITDDINLLAEECNSKGYMITTGKDESDIDIWIPIMEDDSLVSDDDLDTSNLDAPDLENKDKAGGLKELYTMLKEDMSKQIDELGKKLENSVEDLINKNKLVTEDALLRFTERLVTELNEKFDEIKGSIHKKEEGLGPGKEV